MEELITRILKDGTVEAGNILKVGGFINHSMDIKLFNSMGREFKRRFQQDKVTKIVTIEASGIGIASIAAQYFDFVPVVFAKKFAGSNMSSEVYESEVYSYTKATRYKVRIEKGLINSEDRVLIIDDFLANGCAALGLIDIIRQAGATVVGFGAVIEKGFQQGRRVIEEQGVKVESLAVIKGFEGNKVIF